ncbi:hypothetical protein Btru_070664 [Bulinus truncatus]|nr:hypothetical protein Btru_070664 [Bulinus truncatus]
MQFIILFKRIKQKDIRQGCDTPPLTTGPPGQGCDTPPLTTGPPGQGCDTPPLTTGPPACQIKACYYDSEAIFRPPRYAVYPEMLNPHLCTHMIYAFAHIANNKLSPATPWDEDSPWTPGLYTRFNNLKKNNTSLLTLLSVGGWDFGVKQFVQMTSTPQNRKTFIDHAIYFLRVRNFDGLDLRWEHPTGRGGTYRDKTNYSLLIKELKAAFVKESELTKKAYADADSRSDRDLDFISITTYDFGTHSWYLSHPSRLCCSVFIYDLATKYVVDYYIKNGVPKNKLVIGIPMYGQSYYMGRHSNKTKLSWETTEPSHGVGKPNILSYFEICQMIELGWYVGRTDGSPYLHLLQLWAGYDDAESIREKVRYVKRNGYAGVMFWSVDLDDVNRQWCKKFPQNLLESADEDCRSSAPVSSVDPPVPDPQPIKVIMPYKNPYPIPTEPQPELNEQCKNIFGEEKIPYPGIDCIAYISCVYGVGTMESCPCLHRFDIGSNQCNWYFLLPRCIVERF